MEKNYFASNLRYLRSIKGLKQEDLAKICNKSKSTICMWEKEEREPYLEDVILLATYFDVSVDEMVNLLRKAAQVISPAQLWVNPDCGLKTRGWAETEAALRNMVEAARIMRN